MATENKTAVGCGMLVALLTAPVMIYFAIDKWANADLNDFTRREIASGKVVDGHALVSKYEWTQRAKQVSNQLFQFGTLIASINSLYGAVGKPTSIEEVGSEVYLTWNCSDGQVQVVARRNEFNFQKTVAGRVNYY
ncbi:MAG TPA: hypothetical protein VKC60_05675 [Opitutaceae bacterium]|nr:hypothetical protein [Opitutaceae bacterium]